MSLENIAIYFWGRHIGFVLFATMTVVSAVIMVGLLVLGMLMLAIHLIRNRSAPLFVEKSNSIWQSRVACCNSQALLAFRMLVFIFYCFGLSTSWWSYGLLGNLPYFTNWTLHLLWIYALLAVVATYRGLYTNSSTFGLPEKLAILAFEALLVNIVVVDIVFWTLVAEGDDDSNFVNYSVHGPINFIIIYLDLYLNRMYCSWPLNTGRLGLYMFYLTCYVTCVLVLFFSGLILEMPYEFLSLDHWTAIFWYAGLGGVLCGSYILMSRLTSLCKLPLREDDWSA